MENLIYLLKSTAILSLFLLVYEFFLKKETHYLSNRIFLLVGIFIAAVLPFLTIEEIIFINEAIDPNSTQDVATSNLGAVEQSSMVSETQPQPRFWQSLDYVQILLGIYVIVAFFFLLKFLWSLWKLRTYLKAQKNYYFKNGIKYIQTDQRNGAFSIFNTIVYNPTLHNATELDLILKHEEAHVNDKHSVDMMLGNLMVFLNWFNPLVWLYRKRISLNLEFLADRAATKDLSSPKAYQLSLLNYVTVDSSVLPVNNFHKSFIKTRIKKIQQRKSKKYASLKIGLILPVLTVFYFLFQIDSRAEIIYIEQDLQDTSTDKPSSIKRYISDNESIEDYKNHSTDQEEETSVEVLIEKSSTEASLKKIKKLLKKMNGIDFNYSNLRFDQENNLTQIEMSFTDKIGQDFHYSLFGNNPIPTIQLVVSKEHTGFIPYAKSDQSETSYKKVFTIDKNTSDKELETIKTFFTQKNLDFSYRIAKRNKQGEITKIKIEIKDKKGKKSTTAYQNSMGIAPFQLGLKDNQFFID